MAYNPLIVRLTDEIILLLRGFGQIIFQANAFSGLIFMLAIGLNSGAMLVGSLVGAWCSSQSATWFGGDPKAIRQGIYGYNGALIGLSVMLFYRVDLTSLGLIALAAVFSSLLLQQLLQRSHWLPPLTAPFLIMAWLVFAAADFFALVPIAAQPIMIETNPVVVLLRGYGQMLFQANALSGLLILIGVAVSSKADAAWAMFGVILAMVLVQLPLLASVPVSVPVLGFSAESAAQGFYSFSAALIAVVLHQKFDQPLITCSAIVLAVLLTRFFELAQLTALTAPFVLSCWFIFLLAWAKQKWRLTGGLNKKP